MAAFGALRGTLNAVVPGLPLGDILLGNVGDFKRGFVFEVIDTRQSGGALMTKSLVINPRRYTLSEPFAVTLTPTEDNTVVAEENGQIIREITLEGTTGLMDRPEEALGRGGSIGGSAGRGGGVSFGFSRGGFFGGGGASGVNHFYQLRDLFREYGNLKQKPEDAPFIVMVFHNVKEDDHFVVVPRSFETPRDASSNRMHFNYRITLAAIQSLPPPSPSLFDTLGPLGDTLRDISAAVNDARAFWVEGIEVIETWRGRIADPEGFLEDVARSLNDAFDFVNNIAITIAVGIEFLAATNDLAEQITEDIENNIEREPFSGEFEAARRFTNMRHAMERIQNRREAFEPPLATIQAAPYAGAKNNTTQDLNNNTGGATTGTRTRLALGSGRQAGLNLGLFSGSKRVEIDGTGTIDALATQHGVPREAIIALNNLRFPFISRSGAPGTLRPGDPILIPLRSSGTAQGSTPSDRYLTPDDITYGVDIALDPRLAELGIFDILVDDVHGSEDVQLVRGQPNAVQGVQILIGTERGSTDFIPDLGIQRIPGIKGTVRNMLLASMYLREAILSDPRIVGIDSYRIVLEGDVLTQEITTQLIDSRDGVTIVVPFGKAARPHRARCGRAILS